MESENLRKQLSNTIDDLKAEMKAVKKENEDIKSSLQKEHQQCLNLVVNAVARIYNYIYYTIFSLILADGTYCIAQNFGG